MMDYIVSGELLLNRKKQSVASTLVVIFALIAVLIFFFFFAFIPIQGPSMENNIYDGQYCLVARKLYNIERGDIIIVDTSNDGKPEHDIVKRVIAISDDKIIFMRNADGRYVDVYICRNGENKFTKIDEPYIKEQMKYYSMNFNNDYFSGDIVMQYDSQLSTYDLSKLDHQTYSKIDKHIIYVPKNHVFFMGDNRNVSRDSRYYGTRSLENVKYKVLSIMY